ncbi:MAG TPA: ATP citrate lyase citrate-binding domain-containing protein [Candidatus Bathyarchaeia archaeon]|nr:MAG: ATPase [Candidatus Bathyarchaeota archaeon RBG_16_48_13]HJX23193.1 ATP citrate lyase citrate-binding domain-containing protein [Candidatus Bathyarchaeia archaeon]
MAQKAIREYDVKKMIARLLPNYSGGSVTIPDKCVQVRLETKFADLEHENPWLVTTKLVVKPDQLIKRRGKVGLVLLDASWDEAKNWITERINKEITSGTVTGRLNTFIVEPFVPHDAKDEYYFAMRSVREGDEILFYRQGGIDVGDVETKAEKLTIGIFDDVDNVDVEGKLLKNVSPDRMAQLAKFIRSTFKLYADNGFAYLEINPIAFAGDRLIPLDLAAKLDDTAGFECKGRWDDIEFPEPFGKRRTPEEEYIHLLDEKSGASLKLTILNPKGRVWTMIAGGGASVIYTDTVVGLGYAGELANYGEYSGDPTTDETYDYARTVIDLMTQEKDERGKILIIGGGIANFTDVAKTFAGIIKALKEYERKLIDNRVKIYVRRGGPNYQEGLKQMRDLGQTLSVPIEAYGPETHMTSIVRIALGGGQ